MRKRIYFEFIGHILSWKDYTIKTTSFTPPSVIKCHIHFWSVTLVNTIKTTSFTIHFWSVTLVNTIKTTSFTYSFLVRHTSQYY
jgi:hypothetical protein